MAQEFDNTEMASGIRLTEMAKKVVAPFVNLWFRAEVRGLESFPQAGGAMVVCNHSGGVLTPDVIVLAPPFSTSWGSIARCTPSPTMACFSHRSRDGCAAWASYTPTGRTLQRYCTRVESCWCFRRGLRLIPADVDPERNRLQRPQRVREDCH